MPRLLLVSFDGCRLQQQGVTLARHRTIYPSEIFSAFPSLEAFEGSAPLIVGRKQLVSDSGGDGQYRGGLGREVEVEVASDTPVQLTLMADCLTRPPQGLGGSVAIRLSGPHPKSRSVIESGEIENSSSDCE